VTLDDMVSEEQARRPLEERYSLSDEDIAELRKLLQLRWRLKQIVQNYESDLPGLPKTVLFTEVAHRLREALEKPA